MRPFSGSDAMKETHIKVGMTVRPAPLYREQDEMIVQWVGQNENQVLVAGWCPKQLSCNGRNEPRPGFSTYSCFEYGRSFQVVEEPNIHSLERQILRDLRYFMRDRVQTDEDRKRRAFSKLLADMQELESALGRSAEEEYQ
jgi:hypothetical protein